jgi:hypothetical protein
MIILVAIAIVDVALLAAVVWSVRPKPMRLVRFAIARGDGKIPHAL